ncbi:MAG: S41 family peptidase [Caldilineaceae bacterium]
MTAGYYRFPTIHENNIVFVSEDDLWSAQAGGGPAYRLTSNLGSVTYPALSPDGKLLAFVGREEGAPEVYVMPAEGGSARRLTYLGCSCQVVGWNPAGTHVIFSSTYKQVVTREYGLFQVAADAPNGAVETLPYGPARSIAFGPHGEVVLGRNTGDPATWKRYRGGTAGHLWLGKDGNFSRFLADLKGNIASPMWITTTTGERIFFISDHEGIGNIYSSTVEGGDIQRHTDHEDYYARNPQTDGQRIVYHAGADLYVFDPATEATQLVEVAYRSPRVQRNRRFSSSTRYLTEATLYPSGNATTAITRGKAFTFYNHDGPVFQHGKRDGVRYRMPVWFRDGRRLLLVSDESGEETLEIHSAEPGFEPIVLGGLDIGRPLIMRMSPKADLLAVANHRHELLLVDLSDLPPKKEEAAAANGAAAVDEKKANSPKARKKKKSEAAAAQNETLETATTPAERDIASRLTMVDHSEYRVIAGLDWSPDGCWLAYGFGASTHTTAIRLYRLADPEAEEAELRQSSIHTVTRPVLHDTSPAFDPDGRYLYFLSRREFNPVYDALHFDLSFPWGMRPYLLTLRADLPNPFVPHPDIEDEWDSGEADKEEDEEAAGEADEDEEEGEDEDAYAGDGEYEEEDDAEDDFIEIDEDEVDGGDGEIPDQSVVLPLQPAAEKAETAAPVNGDSAQKADEKAKNGKPRMRIDLEGIEQRVLVFPVPDARYGQILGVPGKALFTSYQVEGALDSDDDWDDGEDEGGVLRAYTFKEYKSEVLVDNVSSFTLSANRKKLLYFSNRQLRVIPAGEKPAANSGSPRKTGWVDLSRLKVSVLPPLEWRQMLREAWRLQRDHFWNEDMSEVDWLAVYARYEPLIDRVSCRSEFSDLVWEMQGELGTSHAYEFGGDYRYGPYYSQAHLGAELTWNADAGGYEVGELILGDSWAPDCTSPLAAPGVDVKSGDVIIAVNGQPVDAETSPAQLLVNYAGLEVILTLAPRPPAVKTAQTEAGQTLPAQAAAVSVATESVDAPPARADKKKPKRKAKAGKPESATAEPAHGQQSENGGQESVAQEPPGPRVAVVKTLGSEAEARYRAWVEGNRRRVHEATEGRVGYVHIPDMGATGYAEFHRGYLAETDRDALIVDVRYNGGGNVSQLILEKLARRRIGYDLPRWGSLTPYPIDSVAGPMVALTNEHAASDGDIFCHAFKLMKLGPLIGKRTWGGVVGISPSTPLVDGTITTQPEFSFWVEDVGWEVENYGAEPDIDVDMTPQDYAEGRDAQLERAIAETRKLLDQTTLLRPDLSTRPKRSLPKLPPR